MKEAIKRRAYPGNFAQNYGWVNYRKLKQLMFDKNEDKLSKYRTCDWLVVDDILLEKGSDKMNIAVSSMMDAFFEDRIDMKLPNILVFKFDVQDTSIDIEQQFGLSLNRIIKNNKTFKIRL